MSITDRLAEIQARADKALAGEWEVNPFAHSVRKAGTGKVVCRLSVLNNAVFIAHARTDVPALVAALRAVLEVHFDDGGVCGDCYMQDDYAPYLMDYPCPTVRAVEAALGEADR